MVNKRSALSSQPKRSCRRCGRGCAVDANARSGSIPAWHLSARCGEAVRAARDGAAHNPAFDAGRVVGASRPGELP